MEYRLLLEENFNTRLDQLVRCSRALYVFADLGYPLIYLALPNVAETSERVKAALSDPRRNPEKLGGFWVGFHRDDLFAYTRGLSLLQLPEVEVPLEDDAEVARAMCMNSAIMLLQEGWVLNVGDTVGQGPRPEWGIVRGRRGPTVGETYGRHGSVQFARTG